MNHEVMGGPFQLIMGFSPNTISCVYKLKEIQYFDLCPFCLFSFPYFLISILIPTLTLSSKHITLFVFTSCNPSLIFFFAPSICFTFFFFVYFFLPRIPAGLFPPFPPSTISYFILYPFSLFWLYHLHFLIGAYSGSCGSKYNESSEMRHICTQLLETEEECNSIYIHSIGLYNIAK